MKTHKYMTEGQGSEEKKPAERTKKKDAAILIIIAAFLIFILAVSVLKDGGPGAKSAAADKDSALPNTEEAPEFNVSGSSFMLDTYCTLNLYAGVADEGGYMDETDLRNALSDALDELEYFDSLFGPENESSDIYRINHRTENRVRISAETARLFGTVDRIEEMAGGDLDIAIAPLTDLWDFDERKTAPPEQDVESALEKVHYRGWRVVSEPLKDPLEDEDTAYYFETDHDDLGIDVGAFAKGYIADRLKELLKSEGVTSGIINLGGNVLCIGRHTDGSYMKVGLRRPERGSSDYIGILDIDDKSVVTAGIYERYFEENGVHYHHILDPETGYPVMNDLAAVTIVGDNSAVCDILSTTLLIKGIDEGREFLSRYNEESGLRGDDAYAAFFIKKDGEMMMSDNAEEYLEQS